MGRLLSPRERREVEAMAADLDVLRPGEAAMSERVLDALEAIGLDWPHSYRLRETNGELATADVVGRNFDVAALAEIYGRQLTNSIKWLIHYDPRSVAPRQRNRALLSGQLLTAEGFSRVQSVWSPVFGHVEDQLRVLVCDGPAMLAWVGGLGRRRFDARDRARLQLLTPALQRRLVFEQRARDARLPRAALEAVLDALPGAAMVLDGRRRVVHRNRAAEGLRPDLGALELTPIESPGVPRHWLARARAPAPFSADRLKRRYGLTARETNVLALVARGQTNRAIAVELACSERTVEVHVTRLLDKCGVETRAQLVATLWREGAE